MNGFDLLFRLGRDWQRAVVEEQEMLFAASEVVWIRSMQMLTGRMSTGEATQMVLEKPLAFATAAQNASVAAAFGQDPAAIARAAVRPIHMTACKNARRLRS